MAYLTPQRPEKMTVPGVRLSKERKERLACLTAYDYPTARIVDEAGTDIILVGDSLGNVIYGYETTVPVTMDEMVWATRAVRRGVSRALLVADMPYGSYHTGADDAVRNALRLVKDGGAEAVKLEGGKVRAGVVRRLIEEEIPVMAHIGLTPQSVHRFGGNRRQGKTAEAARLLVEDARELERAGAFSIVLELVPREVAQMITEAVKIPTIGIGAGDACDAQIMVYHDLLGLSFTKPLRHVRQYADLRQIASEAISRYTEDVRNGEFPSDTESFALAEIERRELGIVVKDNAGASAREGKLIEKD